MVSLACVRPGTASLGAGKRGEPFSRSHLRPKKIDIAAALTLAYWLCTPCASSSRCPSAGLPPAAPAEHSGRLPPEPVTASLLHDDNHDRMTASLLRAALQTLQQRKQARAIAGRNAMLAGLVLARRAGHDDLARQAEFQGHEQRGVHGDRHGMA